MKKIINGRKYDTSTATELASVTSNPAERFYRTDETLYRKRTGEFFLYGEGGPMTRWAEPYGLTGSQSGSGIVPLTVEEAREWAEHNVDADLYEEIFGEVAE